MDHRLQSLRILALLTLLLSFAAPHARARTDSDIAVLIMAHGGSSQWNKIVKRAVQEADIEYPTRIFYGMGSSQKEVQQLQSAIDALEDKGAHTIVVVPLLVSSYSEVARQWKYLLGLDVQPGFINNPVFPIRKRSNLRFSEALNDSAVVVEILLDRALEISEQPDRESVIIVSHGPNDNTDNGRWLEVLSRLSKRIQERGRFRNVEGVTLRDDAPLPVRTQAIQALRRRVEACEKSNGRALVVALLLAPGGIEHKISLELRGLDYAFNTKTLLPDSRISEWIRSQLP